MAMNQGKRHIRNTMIALCGITLLIVVAGRIHASVADASTPQWLRNVMSLGLAVVVIRAPSPQVAISQASGLAELRDFRRISVEGDFAVEVVSAPQYKVSLVPASDHPWRIGAERLQDGLLRLTAGSGTAGAVLRVEAPVLTGIEAQGLTQLTLRGWNAEEMTIRVKNVAGLGIEESAVERWILNAETPIDVRADKATFSAGLTVRGSGQIDIEGPAGKIKLRGTNAQFSIRTSK
jgi:hypothetical protein